MDASHAAQCLDCLKLRATYSSSLVAPRCLVGSLARGRSVTDESVRIRVSFMGSTASEPILGEPDREDLVRNIDELPYEEVDVPPTTSLAQVLRKAGALRGFPADFIPSYIALGDDEKPYKQTTFLTTLVLVDDEGRGHLWAPLARCAGRGGDAGARGRRTCWGSNPYRLHSVLRVWQWRSD